MNNDADADIHTLKKNRAKKASTRLFPFTKDSKRAKRIGRKILCMIVKYYQPFTIVEDVGFRELVKELEPRYKIIGRKKLTKELLPECFGISVRTLHEKLEKCNYVAVTTDAWTSLAQDAYLGITCHFIEDT